MQAGTGTLICAPCCHCSYSRQLGLLLKMILWHEVPPQWVFFPLLHGLGRCLHVYAWTYMYMHGHTHVDKVFDYVRAAYGVSSISE